MDGFNKDGKVDIYRDIFDGKTDDEIVAMCEEFFGEFKGNYFDSKLVARENYSRGVAMDNLCYAIRNLREKQMEVSSVDRLSVLKEFGLSGSVADSLSTSANRFLREEATEIVKQGFTRSFNDEPMDKEELERRMNLVMKCCGPDTFNVLMQKTIPQFYYGEDSKYEDDIERLQKDLPQFFQAVDFLVSNGVDLSKIQMQKEMNLQEVYMEVSQKYAKFFSKNNKQEVEKNEVEEIATISDEEQEISRMVDDSASSQLSQQELLQQIQEMQAEINRLVAKQADAIAKLQEMQKIDNSQLAK